MTADNVSRPGDRFEVMIALAHAIYPALSELEVVARKPIQGDATHKVIAYRAADALVQVGWLGPYGLVPGGMDIEPVSKWQPVFVVRDPRSGRSES